MLKYLPGKEGFSYYRLSAMHSISFQRIFGCTQRYAVSLEYVKVCQVQLWKGDTLKWQLHLYFPSLLLKSWCYRWLFSHSVNEDHRRHKFYGKLKMLSKMTGCEEGLSNDWLCCRVGTLILEITPFHGKYFAALLSLSVKSFT